MWAKLRDYDNDWDLVCCKDCNNGRWEIHHCNDENCACRGQPIDIGKCLVCDGTGWHKPEEPPNTRPQEPKP